MATVWGAVAVVVAALALAAWLALRSLARGLSTDPIDDDLVRRALLPHGNVDRVEVDDER